MARSNVGTPISPKVTAGAGGGSAGIAISVILVWLLTSNGVDVPEAVSAAIGSLISTALAAGAAWFQRDALRERGQQAVIDAQDG